MAKATIIVQGPEKWFPIEFIDLARRKFAHARIDIERLSHGGIYPEHEVKFTFESSDPLDAFQLGTLHASFIEPIMKKDKIERPRNPVKGFSTY